MSQQQQQQQQNTEDIRELIRQRQTTAGSAQVLDLSNASLAVFPTEIEFLRDVLEKLTISHNSIRTIPLMLNTFACLRYLNIRANSIRIFPAVLCQISTLEILDMSRNKISRFPDAFGNLMSLRVLSISRNRLEVLPSYIGRMTQLQFLKIEQNHITFPPPEITDNQGHDMETWLSRLKEFLLEHEGSNPFMQAPPTQLSDRIEPPPMHREVPRRTARAASNESLLTPGSSVHRQSRSDSGLRLSIPQISDGHGGPRSATLSSSLTPEPLMHKLGRTGSNNSTNIHGANGSGDDHYRFISHNRGISGDSTSSFGSSSSSNDCERFGEIYFQRLAALPSPPTPLSTDKLRMMDAARGILFSFSQIYRAVKQCIGCSTDEKLGQLVSRLLLNANNALTQLIQSLDRFDHAAQVQVPDQKMCSEILRSCELNVGAFKRLVKAIQAHLRPICLSIDGRLVRNLLLLLHGAITEIHVAWDSLLTLIPGALEAQAMVEGHHIHHVPYQYPNHSSSNTHLALGHHQHPFQLSPTLQATASFGPSYIPQRSQNLSRASNHSAASLGHVFPDDEEDAQLLSTVESSIEAARRLIQCLTETCMTRSEALASSPPSASPGMPRPGAGAWTRSITTSPVRSSGSSTSGKSIHSSGGRPSGPAASGLMNTVAGMDKSDTGADTGSSLSMSPMQMAVDTKASNATNGNTADYLIRSPLFSPVSDTIPYSNGMCVSLPIGIPAQPGNKSGVVLSSSPSNNSTYHEAVVTSDSLPSLPQAQAPRADGRKMSIWNHRTIPVSRQPSAMPSSPVSTKAASSTTSIATSEPASSILQQGVQAPPTISSSTTQATAGYAFVGTHASTPRVDDTVGPATAPPTTTTFQSAPLGARSFSNAGTIGGGHSMSYRPAGIPHQGMVIGGGTVGSISSSLPTGGFLANGGYMAMNGGGGSAGISTSASGPVHPHHPHHPPHHHHFYSQGNNTSTHLATPLSSLSTATLQSIGSGSTPAQLWRDMRDSLNQMTEIVKRLDLDLSMLRVEEHQSISHMHVGGPGTGGHVHGHGSHPHHSHHAIMHPNHPHYQAAMAPYLYTPGINGSFAGSGSNGVGDEGSTLRRRFVAGLNDFVKSVILISTLVKQLSSTLSTTSSNGNNSTTAAATTTTTTSTTTTTITTTVTSSSLSSGTTAAAMALAHLQRNQSPPISPMLMSTATTAATNPSSRSVSSPNQRRSKSDSSTADIVGSTGSPSFGSSMATMNLISSGGGIDQVGDAQKESQPISRPSAEVDLRYVGGHTEAANGGKVAAAEASRIKAGRSSSTSAGGDPRHLNPAMAASPVLTPKMTLRSASMSTIAEKGGKEGVGRGGGGASLSSASAPAPPSLPTHGQSQTHPSQQQQQPEVFSRLVMTSVSSLTKITKELTMRLHKSSFRDLMPLQGSGNSLGVSGAPGGVSLLGHALGGQPPPPLYSSSGMGGGGGVIGGSSSLPGSGFTTPLAASTPYRHPLVPIGPSYLTGRKASLV